MILFEVQAKGVRMLLYFYHLDKHIQRMVVQVYLVKSRHTSVKKKSRHRHTNDLKLTNVLHDICYLAGYVRGLYNRLAVMFQTTLFWRKINIQAHSIYKWENLRKYSQLVHLKIENVKHVVIWTKLNMWDLSQNLVQFQPWKYET